MSNDPVVEKLIKQVKKKLAEQEAEKERERLINKQLDEAEKQRDAQSAIDIMKEDIERAEYLKNRTVWQKISDYKDRAIGVLFGIVFLSVIICLVLGIPSCEKAPPVLTPEQIAKKDQDLLLESRKLFDEEAREHVALLSSKYGIKLEIVGAILKDYHEQHGWFSKRSKEQLHNKIEATILTLSDRYQVPKNIVASIIIEYKILSESRR